MPKAENPEDAPLIFASPMSTAQCQEVLEPIMAPSSAFPWDKRPLRGEVTAQGFVVYLRRWTHNGSQPVALGKFQRKGKKTQIAVTFQPRNKLFLAIWLVLTTLLAIIFGFLSHSLLAGALAWVWFGCYVLLMHAFNRWQGKRDLRELRALLMASLQAPEPPGDRSLEQGKKR